MPAQCNGEFFRFLRPSAPYTLYPLSVDTPFNWAQNPAPAVQGLKCWLRSDEGLYAAPFVGLSSVTGASTALGQRNTSEIVGRSNGFLSAANVAHLYDGWVPSNVMAPNVPVMFYVGGDSACYVPGDGTITINRRAFSMFLIGEQIISRPAQGDDTYMQGTASLATKAKLESVSRCMSMDVTGLVLTSTTQRAYSQRAIYGWVGDKGEFRFHINGTVETLGAQLAGESILNQFPHGTRQQFCWTDWLVFDRAVTQDEIFRVLLPYARTRGVTTEYDNTLIVDGDSLTLGFKSSTGRGYVRRLALSPRTRWVNTALSGITMATLASDFALKPQLFVPTTGNTRCLICVWGGTNDIHASVSGADTYTSLTSYINSAHALSPSVQVVTFTALPRTDNSAPQNVELADYNARILANAAGCDYVIDLTAVPGLTNAANTTFFFVDGIHLNDLGEQVLAMALDNTITNALALIP